MCETCDKTEVCKIFDILAKFGEDAKKNLGVTITIDQCSNFQSNEEVENSEDGEDC